MGTFGAQETAVKRIVRHPLLEKHWRREHSILLKHHHPYLIRCYWTGSTANFHYLVMQRCSVSLNEVFTDQSVISQLPDGESNAQTESVLHQWGLTPIQVIHQFILAIDCLHRNQIVHRDLKPSNILIIKNGSCSNNNIYSGESHIVVGDFGLSRPIPPNHQDVTNSFGPHLSAHMQRIKHTHTFSNKLSSDGSDIHDSHNIYGASVMYGNNTECTATTITYTTEHKSNENSDCEPESVFFTFGTLGWMAPELCDPALGQLNYAMDIFACGLLAFYVLTNGKHPYDTISTESENTKHSLRELSSFNSSDSCSSGGIKRSKASCLNQHHERQLAIAEHRQPRLNLLTDNPKVPSQGLLSRLLIQSMLSCDPNKRPTAEEITYYPLFWPPSKVMRFITELSDILVTKDDNESEELQLQHQLNSEFSFNSLTSKLHKSLIHKPSSYSCYAMVTELEHYSNWIFNGHWFSRLEPELVSDLLSTRGYQDTSLLNLLRAIRNKYNHMWVLPEHVRSILGHNHNDMAYYWTNRFPGLLPLIYILCRKHYTGLQHLSDFVPPVNVSKIFADIPDKLDWWPIFKKNPIKISKPYFKELSCSSNDLSNNRTHSRSSLKTWNHGNNLNSIIMNNSIPLNSSGLTLDNADACRVDEINVARCGSVYRNDCNNKTSIQLQKNTVETNEHRRRRSNQPKKVRPLKKHIKLQQQENLIALAGTELNISGK